MHWHTDKEGQKQKIKVKKDYKKDLLEIGEKYS